MIAKEFSSEQKALNHIDASRSLCRLRSLDVCLAQNYPVYFLGHAIAHDKLFEARVHRVGNIIEMGPKRLTGSADLCQAEMRRIDSFLTSLGLDFASQIEDWQALREGLPFWVDAVPMDHRLHRISQRRSP